jgi:endonuclease G
MKKALLLVTLLVISVTLFAQDVVVLKHTNYTSHYSKSKKYPVLVEWYATKAKIGCPTPLARKDQFAPDPQIKDESDIAKDYVGSGTDRGHMSPAADNLCSGAEVQTECFYFTNMAPQYHSLNAGDWKSLETLTRTLALEKDSIHVWAGNIGEAKKIGRVSVPTICWKVIYIKKTKEYMAFVFDNNANKPDGINNNKVTLDDIQKLTHFKFKH